MAQEGLDAEALDEVVSWARKRSAELLDGVNDDDLTSLLTASESPTPSPEPGERRSPKPVSGKPPIRTRDGQLTPTNHEPATEQGSGAYDLPPPPPREGSGTYELPPPPDEGSGTRPLPPPSEGSGTYELPPPPTEGSGTRPLPPPPKESSGLRNLPPLPKEASGLRQLPQEPTAAADDEDIEDIEELDDVELLDDEEIDLVEEDGEDVDLSDL